MIFLVNDPNDYDNANDSGIDFKISPKNFSINQTSDEWNNLDEWQSQIKSDFDFIYDTLKSVTINNQPSLKSTSKHQVKPKKKSVAFEAVEEIQLIDDDGYDEYDEEDELDGYNNYQDDLEEDEYAYGGLLRPGAHKPSNTARSFEHFLNTQPDLIEKVSRMKNPDDHLRVVRRNRSKSPRKLLAGVTPPIRMTDPEIDYFSTKSVNKNLLLEKDDNHTNNSTLISTSG